MFVCRDHSTGKVFYFHLRKEEGGGGGKKTTASPKPGNSPNLDGEGLKFSPVLEGFDGKNEVESRLVFEVYGVVPPGPEITVDLHKLLERRLIEMTIMEISGPLRRNPLLKVFFFHLIWSLLCL